MLNKLKLHLNVNFPFLKGKRLFIAVSGGIDSMVLLHLFHHLNCISNVEKKFYIVLVVIF